MAPLPSLALANLIVRAYRDDDFLLVVIHGPLRMGKSAYAFKVMGQVYDYLKGRPLSVELMKQYVGFEPTEVIRQWYNIGDKRIPMYVWDDAGYWLYSMDWWHPLLKGIQKYMNVIGTQMNCLMLTTPDPTWILSKLLNMPGALRGKVMKRTSSVRDSNSVKFSRKCRGYKPYRMPDLKKTGVNVWWEDDYSCMIPDEVYAYYLPLRLGYAQMARKAVLDTLLPEEDRGPDPTIQDSLDTLDDLSKK